MHLAKANAYFGLKKVHRSKPRNPLVADICFKAGYIDTWGRGTIKIIEACKKAGLPEPVLKEEQGGFLSKILKGTEKLRKNYGESTEKTQDPLTALRDKYGINAEEIRDKYGISAVEIIAQINLDPEITVEEIAKNIGKSESTVNKSIKKLRNNQIIERIGSRKAGRWMVKF